ncbi:hypothetical protein CcaverHIS002_0502110 [Cutaneotrichosporon cavernicola]|nr:hypothetical protein CcaverHIS002_0502110 [Cutaneotrichosporon cavernicola]BEJ00416.1 hypothetical protein CcaverHIS631_0502730 [Cutaneotrichosporon cavernicola]
MADTTTADYLSVDSTTSESGSSDNATSNCGSDRGRSPTETRAREAYMMYLNALIEARHYLAVLAFERCSRELLASEPVWTRHVLKAMEKVRIALVAYETMQFELELLDISV